MHATSQSSTRAWRCPTRGAERERGCHPVTIKPTGTVTLLFSDIEDSTSRLAQLGAEQYNEALEEHRRILRDAVAKHTGHEFGAAGDALFVAFGSVQNAIRSAVAAQTALNDHAWQAAGRCACGWARLHAKRSLTRMTT